MFTRLSLPPPLIERMRAWVRGNSGTCVLFKSQTETKSERLRTRLGIGSMAAKVKAGKKVAKQLKMLIPAGQASPTPPLGPTLGQNGVNIAKFVKEFNDHTESIKEGVPLPTRITVMSDRSFTFSTTLPTTSYFLKQAAGVSKGASKPGI